SSTKDKNNMSFNRWPSRVAQAVVAVLLLSCVGGTVAAKTGHIVVYWGQNVNEGTLRAACSSNLYSTVILSFLNGFGGGKYNLDLAGHPRNGVGPDVKFCQSKNILVLLSIGGGVGKYSLSSTADAKAVADHLWNFYLGGSSPSRPFG
ncbi:glycosyl hydrolase family 18 protein, partial [Clostridium perfringens]|nr:glycosyl hydrolase family 18 protein [Clostridium perfringens]